MLKIEKGEEQTKEHNGFEHLRLYIMLGMTPRHATPLGRQLASAVRRYLLCNIPKEPCRI